VSELARNLSTASKGVSAVSEHRFIDSALHLVGIGDSGGFARGTRLVDIPAEHLAASGINVAHLSPEQTQLLEDALAERVAGGSGILAAVSGSDFDEALRVTLKEGSPFTTGSAGGRQGCVA
jgi:hypothetical protein